MIIKSIELSNFRNYETLHLRLDKGTNIFFGDNAQAIFPQQQNHIGEAKIKS